MKLIIFFCMLYSGGAYACTNDYQCGYGNRCVKASSDYHVDGVCVTPTDKFGNKTYNANKKPWGTVDESLGVKKVGSCQFDTDCGVGFKCLKRAGSIYGFCVH